MKSTRQATGALTFAASMVLVSACGQHTFVPPQTPPPSPPDLCIGFGPPLVVGTQYGRPVAQSPGTQIFTINRIDVAVDVFYGAAAGATAEFDYARVEPSPVAGATGAGLLTSNVTIAFNVSKLPLKPNKTELSFVDIGGAVENLSLNGVPPFVGDIASASGSTITGTSVLVRTTPLPGGRQGVVETGPGVKLIQIGGRELWIEKLCLWK